MNSLGVAHDRGVDNASLPPIHILSAGTAVCPYVRLAAECLWRSCPIGMRNQLSIHVHLVGLSRAERVKVRSLFAGLTCVTLIENLIQLDERSSFVDGVRSMVVPQSLARYCQTRSSKVPWIRELKALVGGKAARSHLGLYHHEWITAVCTHSKKEEALLFVDADMFVADARLFDSEICRVEGGEFGGGWVWRYLDILRYRNMEYRPVGTELFILNPRTYSQVNCQRNNEDMNAQKRIVDEFPEATFARPNWIDTLYGPSWLAQLRGAKTDIRFKDLVVCHPGGVGHLNESYFRAVPDGEDSEAWLNLNVRRVRMHHGIQQIISNAQFADLVDDSIFRKVARLRALILATPELRSKWESLEPWKDELALRAVAKLMGSTSNADTWVSIAP